MTENSNGASRLALYRKYRPRTFKEVLGQEHIISVLEGSLKEGNISHAYLFAGSRGTGKTTVARILARELGTSEKDLYEIDAASNRGIDDIRELREGVNVLPFDSKYKVYIIDECQMLTKEAFNALLKTLEEPPKHALFILATTEFEKLPETIVSRCMTFIFKKPTVSILKEMVKGVAKKENFTLEPQAADLTALLADGSFRDAHGILQKIFASSPDKKVSVEEVERITSAPKGALVNDLIRSIVQSDIKAALGAVSKAVEGDVDMKVFLKLLLHKVRSIMLLKYAPDMEEDIKGQFSEEDLLFLKEMSGEKENKITSQVLIELLEAYTATGRAYIPQLPLELALVKIIKQEIA
jgi:DNA polymerase-3 subunit gamma/tau